jgi:putative ABC transport system substrate-binding protein
VTSRRNFLVAFAGGILGAPLAVEAQQAAKIARIGYLAPNLATGSHLREAFRQGLRDLGYVEGRNLVIESRGAEGKFERFPALAAELVALKVDVIVASGTLAALAAKRATRSIPIVFPTLGDPATDGLVASFARPGGNVRAGHQPQDGEGARADDSAVGVSAGRRNHPVTSRRIFLVTFASGILAVPLAAEPQQGERVYRIGLLSEGAHPLSKPLADALHELGWIEGKNLKFERRSADREDELPSLAAELVRLKVDLILANGTRATRAAKEATKAIPIVFNLGEDPVSNALVASFARPGGNLTGFVLGLYDEKALEVLKEALPALRRVAYPAAGGPGERYAPLHAAARALGVEIQGILVQGPSDLEGFFAAARRAGAGAVLVENIAWFRPYLERIGAASVKSRLPAIGYYRQFAEAGGLLAYGPTPFENVPRLAAQIDKILKGARPADLPVEQPTRFDLVVNLKTAKALGLTIPPSVLGRADQVIE